MAIWCLGCRFQFECGEKQIPGISFGLVSRMIKNRFKFCLCKASVFEFQFKFHLRKLFYVEDRLFKRSIFWNFCSITMISSSLDGRMGTSNCFRSCRLGFNSKFSDTNDLKNSSLFTASIFDTQH